MADVARVAGVSSQTVSRVANGQAVVRADTAQRVRTVIEQLGYRPNGAARALKSSRSRTIGIITSDTELYGPTSLLFGVEQAARRGGYYVSVASVSTVSRSAVLEAVEHLRGQGVDALAVLCSTAGPDPVVRPVDVDIPTVLAFRTPRGGLPWVSADQVSAARMATRHLLDLGHEHVVHVSGPPTDPSAPLRETGWREALADRCRAVDEPYTGDWSAASGYEAGLLLAPDHSVTAVFAANDQMALGVLRAMHEAGRAVPGSVSVVGFDDVPDAAYFTPPLTTVRQDFRRMGRGYVEILQRQLNDPAVRVRPVLVRTELVVRSSTAPAVRGVELS